MIFTTAGMLNRWGTPSSTGVGVSNHRVSSRRASHRAYANLYRLQNVNKLISRTFNIRNNDKWAVSYTTVNFTIALNNGQWNPGEGTYTLQHDQGESGNAMGVYFNWLGANSSVKQTIVSINDSNNTITWELSEARQDNDGNTIGTITWTRI
uniref:Uncharacterized protein n=1 Tax=viral metagenome TaxID=1070528 RepID=A0A6C0C2L8_9ZZZZ